MGFDGGYPKLYNYSCHGSCLYNFVNQQFYARTPKTANQNGVSNKYSIMTGQFWGINTQSWSMNIQFWSMNTQFWSMNTQF